jgi:hypothetical protein
MHRLDIGMAPNVYTAGCYIDCSHLSSDSLNYRIIDFANHKFEWDGGTMDIFKLMSDFNTGASEEAIEELSEYLYFAAEEAVQWMNSEIVSGTCYWTVEDNSLYLMEDIDGDV